MLSLLNNICGQPFAEYISACFHRADMFSLTKNGWKGAAESKEHSLCFFEKGKLFAGSVSHENICYVYGRGDEWEDKIKQHGLWEEIPDVLEEQIRI